ncbi:root meristem growth factor 10 [Andrographis paniculata]|uniref:root meristem growth factor 10 n=1 Tax=Andrographis paniculata TaxID=175694 RepID=UPI0021E8EEE6|nr:root meristem growth factor 10 [Andrographis paniculata]
MSIFVSFVLLLLCFSYLNYCCNARSFGVLGKDDAANGEFQNPIDKRNEGLNPTRVSEQRNFSTPSDGKKVRRFEVHGETSDPIANHVRTKGAHVSTRKESVDSVVSWQVPHKKRGEQEPGFNLDYLPPKTHPPTHN